VPPLERKRLTAIDMPVNGRDANSEKIMKSTDLYSVMPALFIGHGSPMNAIEQNRFRQMWFTLAQQLPKPRAILCISAHWETRHTYITGGEHPETIHDFYGFPKALFDVAYPAPGNPALAAEIADTLGNARIDPGRGLDHGAWSVLRVMYPNADIPVLQLSLDVEKSGAEHYAFAKKLVPLREQGVLILGSGNIIHNLRLYQFHSDAQPAWAVRFRERVNSLIMERAHAELADYLHLGADAALAIPTPEHYLPLLYALAVQRDDDRVTLFNDEITSALSMTSILLDAHSNFPMIHNAHRSQK
jgi:4,5-DOPA dioxygenase extradiol